MKQQESVYCVAHTPERILLLISGKSVGSKRPLFADWAVPPPPRPDSPDGDGGITLRDLITHVVKQEIAAFDRRQEARRLDRVLSDRQIDESAAKGRVSPEGRAYVQKVDPDQAIGAALEGFEDGLYLVVVDGEEKRDLDAQVFLRDDSRIAFIRLIFLAGA